MSVGCMHITHFFMVRPSTSPAAFLTIAGCVPVSCDALPCLSQPQPGSHLAPLRLPPLSWAPTSSYVSSLPRCTPRCATSPPAQVILAAPIVVVWPGTFPKPWPKGRLWTQCWAVLAGGDMGWEGAEGRGCGWTRPGAGSMGCA